MLCISSPAHQDFLNQAIRWYRSAYSNAEKNQLNRWTDYVLDRALSSPSHWQWETVRRQPQLCAQLCLLNYTASSCGISICCRRRELSHVHSQSSDNRCVTFVPCCSMSGAVQTGMDLRKSRDALLVSYCLKCSVKTARSLALRGPSPLITNWIPISLSHPYLILAQKRRYGASVWGSQYRILLAI